MKTTKRIMATVLTVIVAMQLVACGTASNATEAKQAVVTPVETTADSTTDSTAEVAQVKEPTEEVVTEVAQVEESEYPTVKLWVDKNDWTTPVFSVYNSETKEGIILEDNQEYTLKEGDQLLLCAKWQNKMDISFYSDSSYDVFERTEYIRCDMNQANIGNIPEQPGKYPIELDVSVDGNSTEYNLKLTLIVE